MQRLTKAEMIELIERLMREEVDEDQAGAWIEALRRSIPNPHISDLIFYPKETLIAQRILDKALAYRPIEFWSPAASMQCERSTLPLSRGVRGSM